MTLISSIPLSLQTNPDYLRNWMQPRGGVAGNVNGNGPLGVPGPMLWVQVVDEGSEPFFQASANQPSAAHLTFATLGSNFDNYNDDIVLSILGGFDYATGKMAPPMGWPLEQEGLDALFATDVAVSFKMIDNSVSFQPPGGQSAPYRLAIYTVTFQSLPYTVNKDKGGLSYNPNWIEIKTQATNQTYQSPAGTYVFTSAPTITAIAGTIFNVESSYLEVVCHRLPGATVVGSGPGICTVQQYIGTINSTAIFGAAVKTLEFDSVTIAPYGDWQGQNIYDVHLFFNYRSEAWDKALAPDGSFAAYETNDGHNPPFVALDFGVDIFQTLIPNNEL